MYHLPPFRISSRFQILTKERIQRQTLYVSLLCRVIQKNENSWIQGDNFALFKSKLGHFCD